MQCFISVIYLIIYCNAQSARYRQQSTIEDNLTHPGKVNASNEPDDTGSAPQTKVKVFAEPDSSWNGSLPKISEGELESTKEDEAVRGDAQTGHTTTPPPREHNDKPGSEQVYTGINKEHIKHVMPGANRHQPPHGALLNAMEDTSQIGDSDWLTIINPTIIVNFRGTIFNRDTDIQLGHRKKDKRKPENRGVKNEEVH